MQAGILTVAGCLGDEGQESESGELCLGTGAHSYQQEAQHDESIKTNSKLQGHGESESEVSEKKKADQQPEDIKFVGC